MRYFMAKSSVFYLQKEAWDDIQDYQDNYKTVIKAREQNRVPFLHQSPQFSYRLRLVEYLKKVCIEKKLTHCSLHLAVYLLDVFMDNHFITPERILLVTNVCLLLAAKFEENNLTIPKITELNSLISNRYKVVDYKNLEIVMLRFFHWFIMYPTTAHYVYYYIQSAIDEEDVKNKGISMRSIFYNLHECVSEYLDKIIDNPWVSILEFRTVGHWTIGHLKSVEAEAFDHRVDLENRHPVKIRDVFSMVRSWAYDVHYMQCYPPSKLAAGIIAASRIDIGLSCWTEQLENITDYKREDIQMQIFVLKTKEPFSNCPKCKIIY